MVWRKRTCALIKNEQAHYFHFYFFLYHNNYCIFSSESSTVIILIYSNYAVVKPRPLHTCKVMNRGKASVSSNCEKLFTLEAIKERKVRGKHDFYSFIMIIILASWRSLSLWLSSRDNHSLSRYPWQRAGNTRRHKVCTNNYMLSLIIYSYRVQACVDCEVTMPRPQRPTDGLVYFNIMPSPMASPDYEISSRYVLVSRISHYIHVHV